MKSVSLDQKLKKKQEELKQHEQELSDQQEVGGKSSSKQLLWNDKSDWFTGVSDQDEGVGDSKGYTERVYPTVGRSEIKGIILFIKLIEI